MIVIPLIYTSIINIEFHPNSVCNIRTSKLHRRCARVIYNFISHLLF